MPQLTPETGLLRGLSLNDLFARGDVAFPASGANLTGVAPWAIAANPTIKSQASASVAANPGGWPYPAGPGGIPSPAPALPSNAPAWKPPDYKGMIGQDEIWQQMQKQLAARGIENETTRNAALTRGIAQGGFDVDTAKALQAMGIDPNSAAGQSILNVMKQAQPLAAANTTAGLSQKARLEQQNKIAVRQLMDTLGAQGMARSGLTGQQLSRQDLSYRQATADTINQLLDYMSGAQQAYIQAERERQNQYVSGLAEATNRAYTNADLLGMGARPGEPATPATAVAQNPLPPGTTQQQATDYLAQLPPTAYWFQPTEAQTAGLPPLFF